MSETPVRSKPPGSGPPGDDPWAAFGYLVAGVLFYGAIGWVVSLWLHAAYWIPIGILVGAGFGTYMVFNRYRFHDDGTDPVSSVDPGPHNVGRTTRSAGRPVNDDQGETS
jgi:ATP synthase protein I